MSDITLAIIGFDMIIGALIFEPPPLKCIVQDRQVLHTYIGAARESWYGEGKAVRESIASMLTCAPFQ